MYSSHACELLPEELMLAHLATLQGRLPRDREGLRGERQGLRRPPTWMGTVCLTSGVPSTSVSMGDVPLGSGGCELTMPGLPGASEQHGHPTIGQGDRHSADHLRLRPAGSKQPAGSPGENVSRAGSIGLCSVHPGTPGGTSWS